MGSSIYEGFTVGYLLALTQFVMVWVLGFWYLRKADRDFDPLERKVVEMVERDELAEADPCFGRAPGAEPAPPAEPTPGVTS